MHSMDVSENKFVYCMGVTIISNVRAMPLFIERHVTCFQPINFPNNIQK